PAARMAWSAAAAKAGRAGRRAGRASRCTTTGGAASLRQVPERRRAPAMLQRVLQRLAPGPVQRNVPLQTFGVLEGTAVAVAAIAQQGDDAAADAGGAHFGSQCETGHEAGARRATVATAEHLLQHMGSRAGCRVVDFDHAIDDVEQEAGLDRRPANAFDQAAIPVVAGTAGEPARERAAPRLCNAQPRWQLAIA